VCIIVIYVPFKHLFKPSNIFNFSNVEYVIILKYSYMYYLFMYYTSQSTHPCRLEYDAYRADLEAQQAVAARDAANIARQEELKHRFEEQKVKYDKLRGDVAIKLRFLDENRVGGFKVIKRKEMEISYYDNL